MIQRFLRAVGALLGLYYLGAGAVLVWAGTMSPALEPGQNIGGSLLGAFFLPLGFSLIADWWQHRRRQAPAGPIEQSRMSQR